MPSSTVCVQSFVESCDTTEFGEVIHRGYQFVEEGVHYNGEDKVDLSRVEELFKQQENRECNFTLHFADILLERNPAAPFSIELEKAYFNKIEKLLCAALLTDFRQIKNAQEDLYFIKHINKTSSGIELTHKMRLFKATAAVDKVSESSEALQMSCTFNIQES